MALDPLEGRNQLEWEMERRRTLHDLRDLVSAGPFPGQRLDEPKPAGLVRPGGGNMGISEVEKELLALGIVRSRNHAREATRAFRAISGQRYLNESQVQRVVGLLKDIRAVLTNG